MEPIRILEIDTGKRNEEEVAQSRAGQKYEAKE
jgi:hypothetical protein